MAQQPSASSRAPDYSDQGTTEDVVVQVKQTAQEVASGAKRQAEDQLQHQKQEVTGSLHGVADALHAAGDHLEQHDHDAFAEYAHAAADQVERFTSSIRSRSVGQILDEAQRFAYREPAMFIGGAFLLGLAGARFLKASDPRAGYGSGRQYGSGARTYGSSDRYGQPSRNYGGSVTQHGRPLVTNTPGARMPNPSETSPRSGGMSGGSSAGGGSMAGSGSTVGGGSTAGAGSMAGGGSTPGGSAGAGGGSMAGGSMPRPSSREASGTSGAGPIGTTTGGTGGGTSSANPGEAASRGSSLGTDPSSRNR
jgi:hypothetical protein